jgi:membrane-associated phospholipid phosphatase
VTTAAEPDQATEVPETTATWRTQLARLFSEVFAPWVLIIALFLGVGWHAAGPPGLAWGLLGATFASLGPMSAILTGIIVGRFTDHHLTVREHRLPILILSVALVITGIVALAILGAPRDVVAVEAAMLGGLVITSPITALWKVSFHTGVAAAAVVILAIVYGYLLALTAPIIAIIGWSRVQLRHHTVMQVIAGAPVGAIAASAAFLVAR